MKLTEGYFVHYKVLAIIKYLKNIYTLPMISLLIVVLYSSSITLVCAQEGVYVGNEQPRQEQEQDDENPSSEDEYFSESSSYSDRAQSPSGRNTNVIQKNQLMDNKESPNNSQESKPTESRKNRNSKTKSESDSMLSFNFINYFLQKFKFTDRFD